MKLNVMVRLKGAADFPMYFGSKPEIFRRARVLRKSQTVAEKVLWDRIRQGKLDGFKFRRQHPVNIFIADFYCHEANLVIEIDGSIHDEIEQKERDNWREEVIRQYGLQIIRFSNDEILENTDKVIAQLGVVLSKIKRR